MENWWQSTFPEGQKQLPIRRPQGDIHYIAYGEVGQGPPIILLHGIGSWSFSWRQLIPVLAENFRVIAFDATGHGFSEKPFQWEITHLKQELLQIIEALCDQPAIVIAQSLGGLVALSAAVDYPNYFSHMVLINAAVFPNELPSFGMRWLAALPLEIVKGVDHSRIVKPLAPIVREVVRFARRDVVSHPSMVTYEDVYALTYPFLEDKGAIAHFTQTLQQAAQQIDDLENNEPNFISDVHDHLPEITIPTLILWGDQDQWFPLEHGKKLHQHLPNSRLEVLEDCGHDATACAWEQIKDKVLTFLEQERMSQPLKGDYS